MKKILLSVVVLAGLSATAQTFTVDDTLSAGDAQTYFVADSSATNLDAITGSGVTWDYSNLTKYVAVAPNLDTIINASDSPDAGDFPLADYNDLLDNGASEFFTNYPDSVMSYGYIFTINGVEAKVFHDTDPVKSIELPFVLGATYTDSLYGTAIIFSNNSQTSGDVVVTVDGTGTLNLGTTVFTNVIRTKFVETIETLVTAFPPPNDSLFGSITRTVYSYFDLANANEAVLKHATIGVTSNVFNGSYTAVYSSVDLPELDLGFEDEVIAKLDIYPNPASDFVNISIPENTDKMVIINAVGQTVYTKNQPNTTETINIKELNTGVYFIQIEKAGFTKTNKLVIK